MLSPYSRQYLALLWQTLLLQGHVGAGGGLGADWDRGNGWIHTIANQRLLTLLLLLL